MIRKDLTKVHCEVTGSICTQSFEEESTGSNTKTTQEQETDIYLCLRITAEDKKVRRKKVKFEDGAEVVNTVCKRPPEISSSNSSSSSSSLDQKHHKKKAKGLPLKVYILSKATRRLQLNVY
jgi:predicted transcriptional regulator